MKKNFFSVLSKASLIFFLFLISGCLSTKNAKSQKSAFSAPKPQVSNFSLFSSKELSNGVQLIIKKHSTPFIAVRFVIEGGVSLLKESYSGLENITLELMLKESRNFSAEKTLELQKSHDFSITFGSKKDYSYIELRCAEKDFSTAFPVFADRILNPIFKEDSFNKIIEEKKASVEKNKLNPNFMISTLLRKAAYENHPYLTSPSVTPESLEKISIGNVRQYHKKLLAKEKISIIAVGNFFDETEESSEKAQRVSSGEILAKIDEAFGSTSTIPETGITIPEIPALDFYNHERITQKESAQFGEECYAVAYFNAPDRFDSKYVPYVFAGMIIDDILFDEVKHKNTAESAVQSLGCGIMAGKYQTGVISIFKAKTADGLVDSIDDAIAAFPKEKVIRKELNRYKKDYIMALYEKNLDVSGVADNITTSLIYAKNPTKYLERPDQIEYVTAKQILEAYKTYFDKKNNPRKWLLLTGKISAETESESPKE